MNDPEVRALEREIDRAIERDAQSTSIDPRAIASPRFDVATGIDAARADGAGIDAATAIGAARAFAAPRAFDVADERGGDQHGVVTRDRGARLVRLARSFSARGSTGARAWAAP